MMRQARILMIEDETDILALNQKHFEAQGYLVNCAKTLKEARALLYETPPDLILLDVILPDGSGYDFCKEIRRITTAPILYLTCMGQESNIIKGLMAGGDDYIAKPYSLNMLTARVFAALRRGGFSNAGRIEKPPLIIDHLTGRVTIEDEEIFLSQKEMQLLSFLVCHAGQEFTADELYHSIWGEGSSPSTVRTHVSNLRRKLQPGYAYFEIMLTSGKGYMFIQTRYAERLP